MSSVSAVELFVSGRLCLFGEHTDWAGEYRHVNPNVAVGKTIILGTQEGLYARVTPLDKPVLQLRCTDSSGTQEWETELSLNLEALLEEAQAGSFFGYAAGTAYRISLHHEVGGLRIDNYKTTLPMGKGLSSSAAICVLVARAFNVMYKLKLTTRGEMEFAFLGEVTTPSKCGRMDQACAYGNVPVLMTFDSDILRITKLKLGAPLHLVLVDLKASKDTTSILKCLQAAYPCPRDATDEALHALLGPINHRITSEAISALEKGDLPKLGQLMVQAQHEFDQRAAPLCPEQLTAPILHNVLQCQELQPYIYGGKGVGSQGDGTAQFLCKSADAQAFVCRIVTEQLSMHAMPLTVTPIAQD